MFDLNDPAGVWNVNFVEVAAAIGAPSEATFNAIAQGLKDQGLLRPLEHSLSLSFEGLKRAEELRRGTAPGFKAFMALQFGDEELDSFVDDYVRGAVDATGFRLEKLTDSERAGLIDDRMRVEIGLARFLIVDLTHGNRGAYWEAGYGEGLGKEVIYTCKRDVLENVAHPNHPHFDTNHHLIVKWDLEEPDAATENLKATIRATIPEARQSDE